MQNKSSHTEVNPLGTLRVQNQATFLGDRRSPEGCRESSSHFACRRAVDSPLMSQQIAAPQRGAKRVVAVAAQVVQYDRSLVKKYIFKGKNVITIKDVTRYIEGVVNIDYPVEMCKEYTPIDINEPISITSSGIINGKVIKETVIYEQNQRETYKPYIITTETYYDLESVPKEIRERLDTFIIKFNVECVAIPIRVITEYDNNLYIQEKTIDVNGYLCSML